MMDSNPPFSYLALGDSYIIGEGVEVEKSWPYQLAQQLRDEGLDFLNPKIIAQTGWTTDELQKAINEAEIRDKHFDYVSLSIGVNNQYRGCPFSQYVMEFAALLHEAVAFTEGEPNRVSVVSIPDYGITPFAKGKNTTQITQELKAYNTYAADLCMSLGVTFFNINTIWLEATNDLSLLATDELHPSGKMYGYWVEAMLDHIKAVILEEN